MKKDIHLLYNYYADRNKSLNDFIQFLDYMIGNIHHIGTLEEEAKMDYLKIFNKIPGYTLDFIRSDLEEIQIHAINIAQYHDQLVEKVTARLKT